MVAIITVTSFYVQGIVGLSAKRKGTRYYPHSVAHRPEFTSGLLTIRSVLRMQSSVWYIS